MRSNESETDSVSAGFDAPPDLASLAADFAGDGVDASVHEFSVPDPGGLPTPPAFDHEEGGGVPGAPPSTVATGEAPELPAFTPPDPGTFPDLPEYDGPAFTPVASPEPAASPVPSPADIDGGVNAPEGGNQFADLGDKLDQLISKLGSDSNTREKPTSSSRLERQWFNSFKR